jgi:hypothetical protein
MTWQPIETAPKDGTVVDIWIVDENGNGQRATDAHFVIGGVEQFHQYNEDGSRSYLSVTRDGWMAPGFGYDGETDWCDSPRRFNAHPNRRRIEFTEATHWMPLPAPPEAA